MSRRFNHNLLHSSLRKGGDELRITHNKRSMEIAGSIYGNDIQVRKKGVIH